MSDVDSMHREAEEEQQRLTQMMWFAQQQGRYKTKTPAQCIAELRKRGAISVDFVRPRLSIDELLLASRYLEFHESTGMMVSTAAQDLIRVILSAILSDPHPSWKISPEETARVVGEYVASIPKLLTEIAQEENVQGQITAFDILHYISKDKDLMRLCLIEK